MKRSSFVALAILIALSLTACGQRAEPQAPEGKIVPSTSY